MRLYITVPLNETPMHASLVISEAQVYRYNSGGSFLWRKEKETTFQSRVPPVTTLTVVSRDLAQNEWRRSVSGFPSKWKCALSPAHL